MSQFFGYLLTPLGIIAALGALSNAYSAAQTQSKLNQILTILQPPQGIGRIPRAAISRVRYPR